MNKTKLLSLLFSFIAAAGASAQGTVSGTVVDYADGAPLPYASVAAYAADDSTMVSGATTDDEGFFVIADLPAGRYTITARFMGYDALQVPAVAVPTSGTLGLGTLRMSPSSQLLQDVQVTGRRLSTYRTLDKQVYDPQAIETTRGGTAVDVLQNLPGVSLDGQGHLSLRGAAGFQLLLNGRPVQADPMLVLSNLPANRLVDVEIITAPSAKYDPDGTAGVINITTTEQATRGTYVQVGARYGLPSIEPYGNAAPAQRHAADATVNYFTPKAAVTAGLSYQRNDLTGRREGDVFTEADGVRTQLPSSGERSFDEYILSGQLTLDYSPTKRSTWGLALYGGQRSKDRTADILYYDNRATDLTTGDRLYTLQYFNENLRIRRGDFFLASATYDTQLSPDATLSATLLYEYTLLGGPTTNRNLAWPNTAVVLQDEYNTNDNPLDGYRAQVDYTHKLRSSTVLEAGYQFKMLDHTGDFVYERFNPATDAFELVPEFSSQVDLTRTIHSVYAQLHYSGGPWSLRAGSRLEYMDRQLYLQDQQGLVDTTYRYDFLQPFPSARVGYAIDDRWEAFAGYSRRVQRTTTFKMNPFPEREHSETLEQGDPELRPEFVDLLEAGLVNQVGDNSLQATLYARRVGNLINRVNTVFNDSILNRIYSNVGDALFYGLELNGTVALTQGWTLSGGGTVFLQSIEGTFDDRPVDTDLWAGTWSLNTTLDLSPTLRLTGAVNYLSERVTAQGRDSRYYSPNLTLTKTWLDGALSASAQWLNMDMGLLNTNEQRITTWREGEFYTTTNYVYEVDMVVLNLTYRLNAAGNRSRTVQSEFGKEEF